MRLPLPCRYFAEHDKATALQMLHDSLQPKHKYVHLRHPLEQQPDHV